MAAHYAGLLDGYVIDRADAAKADEVRSLGIEVLVTETVMTSLGERRALARRVLDFAGRCGKASEPAGRSDA